MPRPSSNGAVPWPEEYAGRYADKGYWEGTTIGDRLHAAADAAPDAVALVDGEEATLKRLEQRPNEVILHPANSSLSAMHFSPEQIQIQGVLVGQMRRYH